MAPWSRLRQLVTEPSPTMEKRHFLSLHFFSWVVYSVVSVRESYNVDLLPGISTLGGLSLRIQESEDGLSCRGDSSCSIGYLVTAEADTTLEGGWDSEALGEAGFEAKPGKVLVLPDPIGAKRILIGLGAKEELDEDVYREAGAAFTKCLGKSSSGCIVLDASTDASQMVALVEGVLLAAYSLTTFKSEEDPESNLELKELTIVGAEKSPMKPRAFEAALVRARALARATYIARDLTNAPPAHLTPRTLADAAKTLGLRFGFRVEIVDRAKLEEMGCGGIIGVNRGSGHEARLIRLRFSPEQAPSDDRRLALVGKGITFDSGGLSLKPAASMVNMKTDMGGAAAILGAFSAFADLGVSIPVDAWLPTTDNMISGDSMRVGEIITAYNGKTVEVVNTDAEGRLILMDALSMAAESKPSWIVDIATLTGAQIVALGDDIAAIMGNSEDLLGRVERAGDATGEAVWELPLHKRYMKILDSDLADISNANMSNRAAGSITAGLFLSNFVREVPWVHVDIAGPSVSAKNDRWLRSGATGFGARLLAKLAEDLDA